MIDIFVVHLSSSRNAYDVSPTYDNKLGCEIGKLDFLT